MEQRYDAVIVGAGPGGLAAAAALAEEGLSVLVIDRNAGAGGTSRGFPAGGFTFPCGPLGFSNPRRFAEAAGIGDLRFRRTRYSLRAFGHETRISLPFDELAVELGRLYRVDRQGIDRFFAEVESATRILASTPEGQAPPLGETCGAPASRLLDGLVDDSMLRRLLGTMGTGEPRSGFPLLARMWDIMSNGGIWYPEEGFDRLSGSLADRVKSQGGQFRMRSAVTRISVSGGRAVGVTLADGSSVEAEAVISNSDFKRTFLEMIDERSLPPEWRAAVSSARMTVSGFQVSLGVDSSLADLSVFRDADRIIYRREEVGPAPDWSSHEVDPGGFAGQELEVALWGSGEDGVAPPGCAAIVIRVPADHAHFARFSMFPSGRTSAYEYYKARLARSLIAEVERILPGLRKAVVVTDVATPLTFAEWSMRPEGAVAGWSQRHEDVRDYTVRPLVRTPVGGLFMAGHQAYSWLYHGGVVSAVLSGSLAARCVLRDEGPVSEVTIP